MTKIVGKEPMKVKHFHWILPYSAKRLAYRKAIIKKSTNNHRDLGLFVDFISFMPKHWVSFYGALDRGRTCDTSLRRAVLYPAELRAHFWYPNIIPKITGNCQHFSKLLPFFYHFFLFSWFFRTSLRANPLGMKRFKNNRVRFRWPGTIKGFPLNHSLIP